MYAKILADGDVNFEIAKFTGHNYNKMKKISLSKLKGFSGVINYTDSNGQNLRSEIYKDGSFIKTVKHDENLKYKEAPVSSTGGYWVTIERWIDNWNIGYNGVTGEFLGIWLVSTTPLNNGYEWVSTYTGGMVEGGTYHEHFDDPNFNSFGHSMPDIDTHEEEIILDPSFINTKANCIYNKLNGLSQSFKDMIKKFDSVFTVRNLTFTINNSLPNGNYGVTNPPDNFNITIEFSNTQLANISDVGGAVVFAHEIIHAEIFRKMLSAAKKGDLNNNQYTTVERTNYVNSLRDNFPGLYDYYWKRYKPTWNHEMMAQHYRYIIADIAQQFDNYNLPRQTYEDIAWVGLRVLEDLNNSIAWNNLSTSEQQRITTNITNIFKNGSSNCN